MTLELYYHIGREGNFFPIMLSAAHPYVKLIRNQKLITKLKDKFAVKYKDFSGIGQEFYFENYEDAVACEAMIKADCRVLEYWMFGAALEFYDAQENWEKALQGKYK